MITALIKQNFYLIATVSTVAILFLLFVIWVKYQKYQQRSLLQLTRLISVLFSCLVTPEYPDNVYLFERRVHKQKIKCINHLVHMRSRMVFDDELDLFELIVDIGQIRRRVTDHTIFAVCTTELVCLGDSMMELLTAIQQNHHLEHRLAAFAQAINQFDDLFEHVIKVAAREPLVFVLFISGLRSLLQQCRQRAGLASADMMEAAT